MNSIRRKILTCTLVVCLIFSQAFVAVASNDGESTVGYNEHDVEQVQRFLEHEQDGKKNGNAIFGDSYDVNDPSTWTVDKNCVSGYTSMYCNDVGDNRPFIFDENGNLVKANLLYHWSEETDGLHADDIRSLPVTGSFTFENCAWLTDILCGASEIDEFIVHNASHEFGGHLDLRVRDVQTVYIPIPNSKNHVAFSSAYPTISLSGYCADDVKTLEVTAAQKAHDGSTFIGWYDRFDNRLYSNDCKIDIIADDISACNLVAVYDSQAQIPETVPVVCGDVTGDYKLNTADAVLILKSNAALVSFTDAQKTIADHNKDAVVNTADAVAILKKCTE